MKNIPIQTVEVPIDELIPADYNPRKHDVETATQLKRSMTKNGFWTHLL